MAGSSVLVGMEMFDSGGPQNLNGGSSSTDPLKQLLDSNQFDLWAEKALRDREAYLSREEMTSLVKWMKANFLGRLYEPCEGTYTAMLNVAFLDVIKNIHAWDRREEPRFKTFVSRLVRNACKRHGYGRSKNIEDPSSMVEHRRKPAEHIVMTRECVEVLKEELQLLPETMRACLVLQALEQLTGKEVSQILKISQPQVSRLWHKGIALLKERMSRRGFGLLTLPTVAVALAYSGEAEASERQLSKLFDAADAVSAGKPIPDGTLTPATQWLLENPYPDGVLSRVRPYSPWIMGVSSLALVAVSVPAVLAMFRQDPPAAAVVAAPAMPPVVQERKDAVEEPVVAAAVSKFPQNPGPGQIFTLLDDKLALKIDFCWVPGDNITAGFWMTRTELTQGQWKSIGYLIGAKSNPSYFSKGDDYPVEKMSTGDAVAFAKHFSDVTGVTVRLPSAPEWQFAASEGGSLNSRPRPDAEMVAEAWIDANSDRTTHPVGQLKPNRFNLSDIYGNVFELVTTTNGSFQIRGGSWSYPNFWCTPTYQAAWNDPTVENAGVGIRLVHQPEAL